MLWTRSIAQVYFVYEDIFRSIVKLLHEAESYDKRQLKRLPSEAWPETPDVNFLSSLYVGENRSPAATVKVTRLRPQ
jgi:hypothetical protein